MEAILTFTDDLATRLDMEMRRSGRSLQETVEALLRRALDAAAQRPAKRPFVIRSRPLGKPAADLDFDRVGELLDRVDGPGYL